jgi:hypothetical protein
VNPRYRKSTATDEGMVVSDLVEEVKVNLGEFKPKKENFKFYIWCKLMEREFVSLEILFSKR